MYLTENDSFTSQECSFSIITKMEPKFFTLLHISLKRKHSFVKNSLRLIKQVQDLYDKSETWRTSFCAKTSSELQCSVYIWWGTLCWENPRCLKEHYVILAALYSLSLSHNTGILNHHTRCPRMSSGTTFVRDACIGGPS